MIMEKQLTRRIMILPTAFLASLLVWTGSLAQEAKPPATQASTQPCQLNVEMAKRKAMIKEFKEKVKTSTDPVALAVRAAKDHIKGDIFATELAIAGMDVLLDHWEDPRSEETLAEIAQSGLTVGRGLLLRAGQAQVRLIQLRARKRYKALLATARTPEEKVKTIRAIFKKHPKWIRGGVPEEALVRLLLKGAIKAGGADVVDLIAQTRRHGIQQEYVKKYPKESLEYARKVGRDKILSSNYFLEGLVQTRLPGVVPLLESWLAEEKKADRLRDLVSALSRLPGSQKRSMKLLQDPRRPVFTGAARHLESWHATKESLDVIRKEIDRRKRIGAPRQDVLFLEGVAQDIAKKIAPKREGE